MNIKIILTLFLIALPLHAADKIAIIIGVSDYENSSGMQDLANTLNDASLVGNTLSETGYKIIKLKDPSALEITSTLDGLPKANDIVFYFAGHGVQKNKRNYVLPRNASIRLVDTALEIENGMALGDIVQRLTKHKPRNLIVFLDCCRDLGVRSDQSAKTLGSGLATGQYPGVMLVYAASPGNVALDVVPGGKGSNGPFAESLGRHLNTDADLTQILTNITTEVSINTQRVQTPYVSGALGRDFYFRDPDQSQVAKYKADLKKMDSSKLESITTAVKRLKMYCKTSDELTRSVLILAFVKYRDGVVKRFNDDQSNWNLLSELYSRPARPSADSFLKKEKYHLLFKGTGLYVRHNGEGGGILDAKPMWLIGELVDTISRDWLKFITMESKDSEQPVLADGGMNVSYAVLLSRVTAREKFLVDHYTFPMRGQVQRDLEWHYKVLFYGAEDTPLAQIGRALNSDYLKALDDYLTISGPVWQGRKEAQNLRAMLKSSTDKSTSKIRDYAQNKFHERHYDK